MYSFMRLGIDMNTIKEDGTVSAVPANAMGTSSSVAGTGGIDTYDPLLKKPKKKLRDILRRKPV
jgi:hypothetical protein